MLMSREWQVLLSGIQTPLTDDARPTITQAMGYPQFDWEGLVARACAHGIAPLLYANLQRLGLQDGISAAWLEVLQRAHYRNAARNTLLFQVVQQMLAMLHSQGIATIVLRGLPWPRSPIRSALSVP
jgi:hypothetical protein